MKESPEVRNAMHAKWVKLSCYQVSDSSHVIRREFKKLCREIIEDFDSLPITDEQKPRVGIVGEILVKFLPAANNYLVDLLESEGAEAVVPDLLDFLLYCFYNQNFKAEHLGMSKKIRTDCAISASGFLEKVRGTARKEFEKSRHFDAAGPD